ncbi:DUF3035 domain-containing protein [Roseovarius salinarum]|uniref:DUF3035 domain-containing protein n=1 Tax=Roseovarius salinarum TaxID=1981892 RepID=UPI000C331DEF|nr:DUF3035 domain-containing protein [Roseovarius salinarum]
MSMSRGLILVMVTALGLAACSSGEVKQLSKIRNPDDGPDEFSIIPNKPLEAPENYSELPPPTPGGSNRTDQNPKAEGIAALGGRPDGSAAGGVPKADSALVRHADRYGAPEGIRQKVAREDRELRRRKGRLNLLGIGPYDSYTEAYRQQWLDPYAELRRLRRRGVTVPSAPPEPEERF